MSAHAARFTAHSGLLEWDGSALEECVLDQQFSAILHTVALLESDTAISARQARSFGLVRSPDLSVFLDAWEREEAEHARALRHLLRRQSYVAPQLPATRTSLRRRAIAFVPVRACGRLPHAELIFCAMGAAAEYVTIVTYAELARTTTEPAVGSLLRSIARQEGRHFAFFLAAARISASTISDRSGLVARRLFSRLWRPPGVPSIGLSAWQDVFAPFLRSDQFRERVQHVDHVVDTIPHLTGLNLMRRFLQDPRLHLSA